MAEENGMFPRLMKVYNTLRALTKLKKGVHGVDLSSMEALEKAANHPLYPCYVLPVENLDKLDELIHHEEALKRGLLREIKPIPGKGGYFNVFEVNEDRSTGEDVTNSYAYHYTDNMLVFSHRWLRPDLDPLKSHPDAEDNRKLKAMKNVIAKQDEIWTEMSRFERPLYIWMDYLCVPQRDRANQKKAILSIPAYFRLSCKFCALADDAEAFQVYLSRGWCRLEVVSSRSPKPFNETWYVPAQQHVFYMKDQTSGELDWEHFKNPLDGGLTDKRDRKYIGRLMEFFANEMERFCDLEDHEVYYQTGEREFLKPEDIPKEVVEKLNQYV